eukprot:TRINITY_DN23663_c0_g1_i3.p1 TRINITY_DN23663_c0_g1~~TRINITY_DN23663_c0_g1_i3.p1  ORF type:complete len:224 (+),score=51.26 TRINITY_DN23663_c0_g1_i3:136-807(+)
MDEVDEDVPSLASILRDLDAIEGAELGTSASEEIHAQAPGPGVIVGANPALRRPPGRFAGRGRGVVKAKEGGSAYRSSAGALTGLFRNEDPNFASSRSSARPLAHAALLNDQTAQSKTANLSKEQPPLPKQSEKLEQKEQPPLPKQNGRLKHKEQPPLPKQDGQLKQKVGSTVRLKGLTGYLSSLNGKTGLLEDVHIETSACFVRLPDGCMEATEKYWRGAKR